MVVDFFHTKCARRARKATSNGVGITYTHEMGSLVHKDHLSTSDITCTHGMHSLVHMDGFMGGKWCLRTTL